MKNLLIILISFLLLSSPLFGHPKGEHTLYRWKNPYGDGFLWKGFGDKEHLPMYQGDVENRKPNGLGILFFPIGGKYLGTWENGDMWDGSILDEKGLLLGKYVNGEYIKQ